MKEYIAPELEFVNFLSEEIADVIDGSQDNASADEPTIWEDEE